MKIDRQSVRFSALKKVTFAFGFVYLCVFMYFRLYTYAKFLLDPFKFSRLQ